MNIPNIPKERKKEISDFEKKYQKLYLEREDFRVLYDAIEAFKHKLYFASLSTMWVFIEKHLRDKLIESDMGNINKESKDYWKEYAKKEYSIENGEDIKFPNGDKFHEICKKLKGKGLLNNDSEIEKIYKINRIPMLHGLYGRLFTWVQGLRKEGQIENNVIMTNPLNRLKIIGNIMQGACYTVFKGLIIPLLEDDKSLQ